MDAYLEPAVDKSDEQFSWQRPDLDGLRQYVFSYILFICHSRCYKLLLLSVGLLN